MKDDRYLGKLLRILEDGNEPPKGLKEQLLANTMDREEMEYEGHYPIERFFFEKPWKYAIPLSFIISIGMRLLMGSAFNTMVYKLLLGGM